MSMLIDQFLTIQVVYSVLQFVPAAEMVISSTIHCCPMQDTPTPTGILQHGKDLLSTLCFRGDN